MARPLTRVLIVDSSALFRVGVRGIVESEPNFAVVAEAGGGPEAVLMAVYTQASVVILGAECPSANVVDTVHQILRARPTARVLVFARLSDLALLRRRLPANVPVYLVTSVTREQLVTALRRVATWDDQPGPVRPDPAAPREPLGMTLSIREREVLILVAQAFSNAQIARKLDIAEGTVKRHLRNIFAKLGASSRLDAVNKADAASLIPPRSYGQL